MDKAKIRRLKNKKEIESIGGNVAIHFNKLSIEVSAMNDNILPLCNVLGLSLSLDEFIEASTKGARELLRIYTEREIQKALDGMTEDEEPDLNHLKRSIGARFNAILKEARRTNWVGDDLQCRHATKHFREALVLDEESGLLIDGTKYLEIFRAKTDARQMEAHARHQKAVEAINELFYGVPITWEEMRRYFDIECGRVVINPNSERVALYMRIS